MGLIVLSCQDWFGIPLGIDSWLKFGSARRSRITSRPMFKILMGERVKADQL
jgi:hypothetical protein